MSWSMRSQCLLLEGEEEKRKCIGIGKSCQNKSLVPKSAPAPPTPLIEYDKIKIPSKGGISGRKDYSSILPHAKLPFCWNVALENMTLLEIFPKEIWNENWIFWFSPFLLSRGHWFGKCKSFPDIRSFWASGQCGSSGALWQGFIDFGTSPEYFVRIREKCLKKVNIETKQAVQLFL